MGKRAERKARANRNHKMGGPPCRRCGCETEIREHKTITAKTLAQPFYYRRWFYCYNKNCQTSLIMPDNERVFRGSRRHKASVTVPHDSHLPRDDATAYRDALERGDD